MGKRIEVLLRGILIFVVGLSLLLPAISPCTAAAQSTYTWAGAWTVGIYYYGGWDEPPAWYISFNLEQNGDQVRANPSSFMSQSGNDFRFGLQGVARGNTLEGTLSWDDFGKGDRVASFTFTMSDDGLSFRGAPNVSEQSSLMGNWLGTRENIPTSQLPSELVVTIETDRKEFRVGETATVMVRVFDKTTGVIVPGAELTIHILDNSGQPDEVSEKTNEFGIFEWPMTFGEKHVGTWKIEVFAEKPGYSKGSNNIDITVVSAEARRITFNLDVHLAEEGSIELYAPVPLIVEITRESPASISEPVSYDVTYKAQEVSSRRLRNLALNVEGEAPYEIRLESNKEDDAPYRAMLMLEGFNFPYTVTVKVIVTLTPDVDLKDPHPLEAKPETLEKTVQFEVALDPTIPEEVKQALVRNWMHRVEELGESGWNEAKMYDWIDQNQEVINLYAAYTELVLKTVRVQGVEPLNIPQGPAELSKLIEQVVDKGEDALDLFQVYHQFMNGHTTQAFLTLLAKIVPDQGADYAGKIITAGMTLKGASAGMSAGFAIGGPLGMAIGGVIGALGGKYGGELAEASLEVLAAHLENLYQRHEAEILDALGASRAETLTEFLKNNLPLISKGKYQDLKRTYGQASTRSDGYLHIYDSQGRHTGPDGKGGFEAEIPGSYYYRFDEAKYTFFMLGVYDNPVDEYRFEMEGVKAGHYNLSVVALNEGEVKMLVDVEDAAMESGKTYPVTVDTKEVFTNVDTVPPTINNFALSSATVPFSSEVQYVSVIVRVTDNIQVFSTAAILIKDDQILTHSPLFVENETYVGEIFVPVGLPEGEYRIKVLAYDQMGNAAESEAILTIGSGTFLGLSTQWWIVIGAGLGLLLLAILVLLLIVRSGRRRRRIPPTYSILPIPGPAAIHCQACGKALPSGQRFCGSCGADSLMTTAPLVVSPVVPAGNACPACGRPVNQGDRFCQGCGGALPGGPV